jgi:hypothetical protein
VIAIRGAHRLDHMFISPAAVAAPCAAAVKRIQVQFGY